MCKSNFFAIMKVNELNDKESHISIYPNPSEGIVYISSADKIERVSVTDALGRQVYEVSPQKSTTIISLFKPGIYFFTITSGDKRSTEKLLVN